jgi:hypothetical protein
MIGPEVSGSRPVLVTFEQFKDREDVFRKESKLKGTNIHIRSEQCCGSESEIIRMFWLDPNPNPKKKFGFGYGFRHCCRMKIFVKNQKSNT